jgi:hypothetical protein
VALMPPPPHTTVSATFVGCCGCDEPYVAADPGEEGWVRTWNPATAVAVSTARARSLRTRHIS